MKFWIIQISNQQKKNFVQQNKTTNEKKEDTPHIPLQPKESSPRIFQKSNEASNKTQEDNSNSIQSINQDTSSSNKVQNDTVSKKDVAKENQDESLKSSNITKNSKVISPPAVAKPTNGARTSNIPNTIDNQKKQITTTTVSKQVQVPKQNQNELLKLNKTNERSVSKQIQIPKQNQKELLKLNKTNGRSVSKQVQVPKQNQKELLKLNKTNERSVSTQRSKKLIVVEKKK